MMRNDMTDSKKGDRIKKNSTKVLSHENKSKVEDLNQVKLDADEIIESNKQSGEIKVTKNSLFRNYLKSYQDGPKAKLDVSNACDGKKIKDAKHKAKIQFIQKECLQPNNNLSPKDATQDIKQNVESGNVKLSSNNKIESNYLADAFRNELILKQSSFNKKPIKTDEETFKRKSENPDICNREDVKDAIHKAKLQFSSKESHQPKKNSDSTKDATQESKQKFKESTKAKFNPKSKRENNILPGVIREELTLRQNILNKNNIKSHENDSKRKSENPDICNRKDVRDSIQKAKSQFTSMEVPQLNKKIVLELNKKLLEKSENEKICKNVISVKNTVPNVNCNNTSSNSILSFNDVLKQGLKDNNNGVHKVSFKTKNFSKKPFYNSKISTTLNSSTVASLTQKFNEIIKEKDLKPMTSKTSLILECKNSECINVKRGKNNTFIIQKTYPNKRSNSINSFDKVSVSSPLLRKKVLRVKSDSTEKKKSVPRRGLEHSTNSFKGSNKCSDSNSQSSETKLHAKRPTYKTVTSRHCNNVRAAIQKFESAKIQNISSVSENSKNTVITLNIISEKPKIPEKKVNIHKTKNLVIRDGKPKIKLLKTVVNENKTNILTPEKILTKPIDIGTVNVTQQNSKSDNTEDNEKIEEHVQNSEPLQVLSSTELCDKTVYDIPKTDVSRKVFCDGMTGKMQPNQSFLWRNSSVSTTDNTTRRDILSVYEPTFEEILQRADKVIECNKKEIANKVKNEKCYPPQETFVEAINSNVKTFSEEIVEAINTLAITDIRNIRSDILVTKSIEEDYETFDNCENDIDSNTKCIENENTSMHSKSNCPLPEVPQENIYQQLSDSESLKDDDNVSINSSEYYHEIGDKTSDDFDNIYEYCESKEKSPVEIIEIKPELPERKINEFSKVTPIAKSNSIASSVGYEKISSIYEKNNGSITHIVSSEAFNLNSPESVMNYYNSDENIYDTIKPSDSVSFSHCYESIPASPQSIVKMHQKRNLQNLMSNSNTNSIQFDSISNFSQSGSVMSCDQKTNSIYGQRSIASLDASTIVSYGKAVSEVSSSDRSDDWEDLSDPEINSDSNTMSLVIVGRTRGRHSPASWSKNQRHRWNKKSLESDMDSGSDGENLYETLSYPNSTNYPENISDDDNDSFESYSESEQQQNDIDPNSKNSRLPDPPISNSTYTLTRLANKMKKLKENFTKSTRKKSNIDAPNLVTSTSETNQNVSGVDSQSPVLNNTNEYIYKNNSANQMKYLDISLTKQTSNADKSPLSLYKTIFFNSNDNKSSSRQNSNDDNEEKSISNKTKTENQNNKKTYLFKSFRRSESATHNSKKDRNEYKRTNSTFYVNDLLESSDKLKSDDTLSQSNNKLHISPEFVRNNESTEENEVTLRIHENDNNNTVNGKRNSSLSIIKSSFPRISSIRPNAPPPPPPNQEGKLLKKDKKAMYATSWYSDCDISRSQDTLKNDTDGIQNNRASAFSLYAEIGLYQASNVSTSSGTSSNMSGSGTCSTSAAFSSPSTPICPIGMFNHEPLYQFYDASKLESVCRDIDENFELDSDVYEEIAENKKPTRPSAMALISPKKSPSRTLWCEVSEVIKSTILLSLTDKQRKVQEAKFEIITSEASYFNSLIVLESHFINHPAFRDEKLLTENEKNILFGNISPVKKCSERFLADLENCWQDNILLNGLSKIIKNHAEKYFSVYVNYCEHQNQLVKTLKKLKATENFSEAIYQLQAQPECQSLSIDSFLLLPMQRITRLPLLVDAVLKNLIDTDTEYRQYVDTLTILNNVVTQCNEAARNFERKEEMLLIASQLEFSANMQGVQLITSDEETKQNPKLKRWLVRSGDLIQLMWRGEDQSKLTFGRKIQKSTVNLFLFTDLLVITKKKSTEDKYIVIDYCKRSLIEMISSETMMQSPKKEIMGKYSILLTMLENFENKTVEMLLSCKSESDRQRWLEACSLPSSENPNEKIYEDWDQPQVAAMYPYQSTQPDELSLQRGDIIYVNKKIVDGWYHGERMRDGESGWFPGNYTVEIASSHVRARNIKQRYRLLNLTGSYLNQQKKKAL